MKLNEFNYDLPKELIAQEPVEPRDSCRLLVARFGVRCFRSVQGFNDDDCGFRALVLRGTCMKTSRLSSTRSSRLR